MSMSVAPGDKEGDKIREHEKMQMLLVHLGIFEWIIPLNGGSETRKEIKLYYMEKYSKYYYVEVTGYSVTIRSRNDIE